MPEPTTLDVTTVPLRDLWRGDGSALDQAIAKVLKAAEAAPADVVSAFNSAI
jgi:FXSXX-COOH protein